MKFFFACIVIALYFTNNFFCIRAIKQKDSKAYKITKPLLMPLLILVFICLLPKELRSTKNNVSVIIALCFHTIGDIMLLFPKGKTKVYFYIGLFSFFAGHCFYVGSFLVDAIPSSGVWGITGLVIIIGLEYLFYRELILDARRYAPFFLPYSFGLSLLFIVIFSQLPTNPRWFAALLSLIGTLSFAFSDYCIARREIRIPIAGQMVVMPTYIAGQALIVGGILLSQI